VSSWLKHFFKERHKSGFDFLNKPIPLKPLYTVHVSFTHGAITVLFRVWSVLLVGLHVLWRSPAKSPPPPPKPTRLPRVSTSSIQLCFLLQQFYLCTVSNMVQLVGLKLGWLMYIRNLFCWLLYSFTPFLQMQLWNKSLLQSRMCIGGNIDVRKEIEKDTSFGK